MLAPRRLPGIRVDVAPPPVAEALPRMDVAVFAGFASTGPLHVPVLITSVPHFASVFGADAPLAWDAKLGERVMAHLGGAVRGFFANGGRRCWVIRVARSTALEAVRQALRPGLPSMAVAHANLFPVAGVLEISADGEISPALVQARSEGSWSDGLRLATALQQRTLGIVDWALVGQGCEFRTRQMLSPGELLELRDGDTRIFAVVESTAITALEVANSYHVTARFCAGFESLDPALSPPLQLAGVAAFAGADSAPFATLDAAADENGFLLQFTIETAQVPQVGQWLRFVAGGDTFWMQGRAVTQQPVFGGSPGTGVLTLSEVRVQGPVWGQLDVIPASLVVDRVFSSSLEMRAENRGDDQLARIGAGLTPAARNAWWQQTTDDQLYRAALDNRVDTLAGPDEQQARFPLAPLSGATPLAWIPLAVDALFSQGVGPLPGAATALERDGLADFDASLFLDPELARLTTDEVAPRAEMIRFLREVPRALFGIHAVLSIGAGGLFGECSLLCVPDAVQLGWRRYQAGDAPAANPPPTPAPAHWSTHRGPCAPPTAPSLLEPDHGVFLDCGTRALPAPLLSGPDGVIAAQSYPLQWTASEPGAGYVLSEAQLADFGDARTIYSGDLEQFTVQPTRDGVYYYRVYAMSGAERSADSNVIAVQVRQDQWLQIDADDFALDGEPELLRLQRALLRLAASNGELFTILALPRHYRAPAALRFAGRLANTAAPGMPGDADSFAVGEARTLSYGALYHPWLVCASLPPPSLAAGTTASPPRALPPDGAIAGTFAARATRRGAWVAPANERLLGVVALTPELEPEAWQGLQDAAVNVIRDDASGFMTLSADTLSQDFDLRMINVRRLMILLRRLALRRGTSYVFEPNGPTLRRAVQRGFDTLLGDLFRRGAFSGRTAESSFRVVTDDTVNTPLDNDAGRFIVELHIAPSMPMRFLTLLLAQSGERLTVTEEL